MTYSNPTTERAQTPKRMAGALAILATAALLGACALEPGRPYDFSQVNGGYQNGYAQTYNPGFGQNEPTYYPR